MTSIDTFLYRYSFSSSLPDIVISAEEPTLITVKQDDLTIYSETLTPYNGKIVFRSFRDIVEANLLQTHQRLRYFTVHTPNTYKSTTVLYTRQTMLGSSKDFMAEKFLTLHDVKRLATGAEIFLPYMVFPNESLSYKYIITALVDGDHYVSSHVFRAGISSSSTSYAALRIPYADLIAKVEDSLHSQTDDIKIESVTVSMGDRSAVVFFDDNLNLLRDTFYYTNNFDFRETITLPTQITHQAEATAELATIGGKSYRYDAKTTFSYVAEIGPLLPHEDAMLEELAASPDLFRMSPDLDEQQNNVIDEVVLTEAKLDFVQNAVSPNSAKITFQYPDQRKRYTAQQFFEIYISPTYLSDL